MDSCSKKPTRKEIIEKHNNMLGASIEALLNYCKNRFSINRREKCALIRYDTDAKLIFKGIYVSEEDKSIKDYCLNLNTKGATYFKKAFEEAEKIINEINVKKEYIPIIILLTDGDDWKPEETINYIKDTLMANEKNKKYGLRIFCIYFQNGNDASAQNTLEQIAQYGNTEHYYHSDSLENLFEKFETISQIIEKNYKLKLNN